MFERYTEQARLVIVRAQEEARDLSHHFVGTQHLLLALTRDDVSQSRAHRILAARNVTRNTVLGLIVRGEGEPGNWHLPFTPAAKEILDFAWHHSGDGEITAEHFLLALTHQHDGVTTQALDSHRARIREDLLHASQ